MAILRNLEVLKKYKVLILICLWGLLGSSSFGQNKKLETTLYQILDHYVENPSQKELSTLQKGENIFLKSALPKTKSDYLAYVILLCNHAYYSKQYLQTEEAIILYEKAWQTFEQKKLQEYDIIEYCLKPLGNLYTQTGNFIQAENTIKHYYATIVSQNQTKNRNQLYAAILNLSNVYQGLGKYEDAITLLKTAIQEKSLSPTQVALVENNLGANLLALYTITHQTEKLQQATYYFEHSTSILQKSKTNTLELSNGLRNLAAVYLQTHHFEKATTTLLKAEKIIEDASLSNPYTLTQLQLEKGQLFILQKKYNEVQQCLQKAYLFLLPNQNAALPLPDKKKLYAHPLLVQTLDLQAQLLEEKGKYQQAIFCYEQAHYLDQILEENLMDDVSQVVHQIQAHERCDRQINLYLNCYQTTTQKRFIESAFQLVEDFKKRHTTTFLAQKKQRSKAETILIQNITNCQNAIIAEQSKQEQASLEKITLWIAQQNQWTLMLKDLRIKQNLQQKTQKVSTIIQESVSHDFTYLSYFWGKKHLYLFQVAHGELLVEKLPNTKELEKKLRHFYGYFSNAENINQNLEAYKKEAFSLYQQLKPKGETSKMVINPDGLLQFLPFETLLTKPSSSISYAKIPFLIQKHHISYSKNTETLFQRIPQTPSNALGVFPEFKGTDFELPFSHKEEEAFQKLKSVTLLKGKKATYSQFLKEVPKASILHFCTHASAGDDISPASLKFRDQEIPFRTLYNLHLTPNLVVLSACETGIGLTYNGQNAMSVARGFEMAGTSNQLYSLWKVNDYTTSLYMTYFYGTLLGHSYSEANWEAKVQYLQDPSLSNVKKSPYFWAPMVYYGTINEPECTFPYLPASLGILISFILFWGIKKIRSRKS